jgi:hypothetical protein
MYCLLIRALIITLMMEAVCTSETSAYFETAWRYAAEGHHL